MALTAGHSLIPTHRDEKPEYSIIGMPVSGSGMRSGRFPHCLEGVLPDNDFGCICAVFLFLSLALR
jgi:hypothetical protein